MPWRREVTIDSKTSLRIRTGRRALRASATVIGSILVYDFEPKPPPRYGHDHAHLRERHVEQGRDLGAHQERVLAGGVHA